MTRNNYCRITEAYLGSIKGRAFYARRLPSPHCPTLPSIHSLPIPLSYPKKYRLPLIKLEDLGAP